MKDVVTVLRKGDETIEIVSSGSGFYAQKDGSPVSKEHKILGPLVSCFMDKGYKQGSEAEDDLSPGTTPCGQTVTDEMLDAATKARDGRPVSEGISYDEGSLMLTTGLPREFYKVKDKETKKYIQKPTGWTKPAIERLANEIGYYRTTRTGKQAVNDDIKKSLNAKYKHLLNELTNAVMGYYAKQGQAEVRKDTVIRKKDGKEMLRTRNVLHGYRDAFKKHYNDPNIIKDFEKARATRLVKAKEDGKVLYNADGTPKLVRETKTYDSDTTRFEYALDYSLNKGIFKMGNKKIGNDTLIFSMISALSCPSAKYCPVGGPNGACYAAIEEKMYKMYFARNERNRFLMEAAMEDPKIEELLWDTFMTGIDLANANLKIYNQEFPNKYPPRIRFIRINEAGDFINAKAVEFFDRLAEVLKKKGIRVYCYTANNNPEVKEALGNSRNIVINASTDETPQGENRCYRQFNAVRPQEFFEDFGEETSVTHERSGKNNSVAIPHLQKNENLGIYYYRCPCGLPVAAGGVPECRYCGVCYDSNPGDYNGTQIDHYTVVIMAHGALAHTLGRNYALFAKWDVKRRYGITDDDLADDESLRNMVKIWARKLSNSYKVIPDKFGRLPDNDNEVKSNVEALYAQMDEAFAKIGYYPKDRSLLGHTKDGAEREIDNARYRKASKQARAAIKAENIGRETIDDIPTDGEDEESTDAPPEYEEEEGEAEEDSPDDEMFFTPLSTREAKQRLKRMKTM